ncbi:MAG: EI24 domain-containing protein [Saprospiraceae bacterium]|nr:EI24 domain-containing protein [Saprospiraceae bacterium]
MIRNTFKGLSYYSQAASMLLRHNLWMYFIVPTIASLLLVFTVFKTRAGFVDKVQDWLGNIYPDTWFFAEQIEKVLALLGGALGEIFVWLMLVILMKHIVMIIASPFMSLLSERIEQIVTGKKSTGFKLDKFFSDILRGLRVALRLLIRELFWSFLIFLLSFFIPPVTAILLFLVQAYYGGAANMDFTLERFYSYRGSVAFMKAHKGAAIGNGIPYIAMLMTIFGFLIALPLSTAAATLHVLDIIEDEDM